MLPDDKGFEGRSDLGIYHHFTVAIDTDNIKRVFADVRDMGKAGHTFFFCFIIASEALNPSF